VQIYVSTSLLLHLRKSGTTMKSTGVIRQATRQL
jgi:hypothetical protein